MGVTTTDQQQAVIDGPRQLGEQLPFNRHLGVEVVEVRPAWPGTRLRAAGTGECPRFDVEVTVTDTAGAQVALASLHFVYLATTSGTEAG